MFNMEDITILTKAEMANQDLDSYYKALLNLQHLYDRGITGKGLTCAVIDSGCDPDHPLLRSKIIGGCNFTKEGKGKNDFNDENGHGTHVAALISSNSYGPFAGGVAPGADLLICKALGKNGSGDFNAIIKSINYAVDCKVDVINMSLGGPIDLPELYEAVKRAYDAGIVICCASGNEANGDNGRIDEFCYPGAYIEVIEVGAINKEKQPSYFSNSNNLVDCVCYGERILSCYPNDGFALLDGTSQATPQVAGCVLLIKDWFMQEFGRKPSNNEVYAALIKCSKELDGYNRRQTGFGYIDLDELK